MTVVVGGAYREECLDPTRSALLGSGVRAAAVLADTLSEFVTAADPSTIEEIVAATGVPPASIRAADRVGTTRFVYETPIARPLVYGVPSTPGPELAADDDDVVVFGMVDAVPKVTAKRCVVDPQSSLTLDVVKTNLGVDRLVLVANAHEVLAMTGADIVDDAAALVVRATDAAAVVVKLGVGGALVYEHGTRQYVPPHPTGSVWPIGSGDAFTAGFARAWFAGSTIQDATAAASVTAAVHVSTRQIRATGSLDAPVIDLSGLQVDSATDPPRVYLAGSFATLQQRWLLRHVARAMSDVGIEPYAPLDHNGLRGDDAAHTARSDLVGIETSEAVLVLADHARTGPWVEAGWALRHGVPVVVFTEDATPGRFTMAEGGGGVLVRELASAVYRAGWAALATRA